jgi:hypothetical protein
MATDHREANDSLFEDLLREAVSYLAEDFESSEDVSGAALVEWFSEWRVRAGRALSGRTSASGATPRCTNSPV